VSNNQTGEVMNLDQLVTHRVLRDPVQLAVLVSPVTAYLLGVYRVSRPGAPGQTAHLSSEAVRAFVALGSAPAVAVG
jgi:hypothetical protein